LLHRSADRGFMLYIYIYIYIYTHTHIHITREKKEKKGKRNNLDFSTFFIPTGDRRRSSSSRRKRAVRPRRNGLLARRNISSGKKTNPRLRGISTDFLCRFFLFSSPKFSTQINIRFDDDDAIYCVVVHPPFNNYTQYIYIYIRFRRFTLYYSILYRNIIYK
jgi:hypothetical protein